jgi:predicted transposase/invertase (TIGR01784 family)
MHAHPKYISPLTDWGFKKLFGQEDSKDNLIAFLNAVFHQEGLPWIERLELKRTEYLGNSEIDRTAIFDLYAIGSNGEHFIIELQKLKQKNFYQRSVFYSTFAVQDSAVKGEWDFQIKPVYVVGILDFKVDEAPFVTESATIILNNRQTEMMPHYKFFFLECSKIQLSLEENSSKRDKWLYIFKYLERLNETPEHLIEPEFKKFLDKASFLKLPELDKADYNASMKYRYDLVAIEKTNFEKGVLEGMQQGIEAGREEGEKQKAIAIAKNLLKKGLSVEDVALSLIHI